MSIALGTRLEERGIAGLADALGAGKPYWEPVETGAGNGNRTRMASLEGWNFTIKLCPLLRSGVILRNPRLRASIKERAPPSPAVTPEPNKSPALPRTGAVRSSGGFMSETARMG